jgi:AcrR family transcriptional regulator
MAAARELFAARGYAGVPADDIVRAAGVTRGALYHHYVDKQSLFRAVVEEIHKEITAEIRAVLGDSPDPRSGMAEALRLLLDACLRDEVRRISLTDAPAVLGWVTMREIEAQHGLGLIVELLDRGIQDGQVKPQPVRTLAPLLLSALAEAVRMIAEAEDPAAARSEVEQVLGTWFVALLANAGTGYTGLLLR